MSQIDITKMSSKGQIVIPAELRRDINEGDKMIVIRNNDQIILKKANKFDRNLEEDLKAAKMAEEGWKDIREGRFKRMPPAEFIKELRKLR